MHNAKKLATKKQACAACVCLFLKAGFWRRPTLPHGGTIGADCLNCSVRDGKRCNPVARVTRILPSKNENVKIKNQNYRATSSRSDSLIFHFEICIFQLSCQYDK